jgi:hypothetical protein
VRGIYYTGLWRAIRILSRDVSSSNKNGKQIPPESETDLCLNSPDPN